MDCTHRNLPYPEESEEVVDAVCVKKVSHFAKTGFPPSKSVLAHLFPVVGRESPVLPVDCESIRRCTGACIKVEEFGTHPCINACAAHPDWNIPFEGNSGTVAMGSHLTQLRVKMILEETVIVSFFFMFGKQFSCLFRGVNGKFSPPVHIGGAMYVPEDAECNVWFEPSGVALYKFLV